MSLLLSHPEWDTATRVNGVAFSTLRNVVIHSYCEKVPHEVWGRLVEVLQARQPMNLAVERVVLMGQSYVLPAAKDGGENENESEGLSQATSADTILEMLASLVEVVDLRDGAA